MTQALSQELRQKMHRAMQQLATVVVGKNDIIALSFACLLARGHLLLEDLPGAGKTTLAKAFAATLGLDFRRIQFTSDLLPADIIGFSVLEPQAQQLRFRPGPIFTQLLLADEINRASPKSQSALLEAMEEHQVSADHTTHLLPKPFFVIATQNPLEQIGTFALPESQLDRFLMCLSLGYLPAAREAEVLRGISRSDMITGLRPVLRQAEILALQEAVLKVHVSSPLAEYVQKLLACTRNSRDFVHGLSTRAGIAVVRAAQAYALMRDENAVLPEHVQKVFPAVAGHRLQSPQVSPDEHLSAVQKILGQVAVPL